MDLDFEDCFESEKSILQLAYTRLIYMPGLEVINMFRAQLSMNFFLLIIVKMPTIVGILTFMSRKNTILGLS